MSRTFNYNIFSSRMALDRPVEEWLDHVGSKSPGKQGFTGIMSLKESPKQKCIYKVSQYDDYLIRHEFQVMKSLEKLANYCPHFHRAYGLIHSKTNLHLKKECLSLDANEKHVPRDILLTEYISNIGSLCTLIESDIQDVVILSLAKQVLASILLGQKYKFTHYDLHPQNILISRCDPEEVLMYVLDEEIFLVPTFGYMAHVIDFGYSYCEEHAVLPLHVTLEHTDAGFISDRFDKFTDFKLFLITLVNDTKIAQPSRAYYSKMRTLVRNVFEPLRVYWDSGWDKTEQKGVVKTLSKLCKDFVEESKLLRETQLWIDIIGGLINLPLEPLPYHSLEMSLRTFARQFSKIEERIGSRTLLYYILRVMVDLIRDYRGAYLQKGESQQWAIFEFRRKFLDEFGNLVEYFNPKIHYEKLFCSCLLVAESLEGLMYEYLMQRVTEKEAQYTRLELQNPNDYFKLFEHHFPTPYDLSCRTRLRVIDQTQEKEFTTKLHTDTLTKVNAVRTRERPKVLWECIKKFLNKCHSE